jgi:hypothetical protein
MFSRHDYLPSAEEVFKQEAQLKDVEISFGY